jgi:hypothetical protein
MKRFRLITALVLPSIRVAIVIISIEEKFSSFYIKKHIRLLIRRSSVSIVSGCVLDVRSSVPCRGGYYFRHIVQTDRGAHTASYPVNTVGPIC